MGSAIWKSWAARMTKPVAVIATDIAFWNPGYGSHRRIEQICQSFSKFFTVKVFVFKTISKRIQSLIDERNYDFEVISYKSYENKFQGKLRTKPEDIHVSLRKWYAHSWQEAFHHFIAQTGPAVVVTEYLRMQYLIREISPDIITILDSHDIVSLRGVSFYAFGENSGSHISLDEEVALMESYNFILAISKPDYAWLRRFVRPGSAVFLPFMPSVGDLPAPIGSSTKRLVFAGANSPANATALQWFVRSVFPYLPEDITLSVYGDVGRSVQASNRLQVHGIVDNVADIYRDFGVAINPVYFGGGLKIKSLEALWAGLPLIASAEGARGVEQFAGPGMYIARSRQEFFDHVCEVSQKAYSAETLVMQRREVLETYQADAECLPFFSTLRQLTKSASRWNRPRSVPAA
jgi:glycosyltransferase involved in cell wall biosynthesis